MKFRAAVTVLIIAACTTSSGADNHNPSFRIPDPEEIFEAYENGFIDYDDYLELLEIARGNSVSSQDSIFLMQFPDLVAGISSNPLLNPIEDTTVAASGKDISQSGWTQSFLFRQYYRLDQNDQRRQFYRLQGTHERLKYYGELERGYTSQERWGRRTLQYDLSSGSKKSGSRLMLGNFREKLGMGLTYGYHGQLLSKTGDRDGIEQLLFPSYGGANGVLLILDRSSGVAKFIYDTDRNEMFSKHLAAVSIPFRIRSTRFSLSVIHGLLRNRERHVSKRFSFISISGGADRKSIKASWELALAADDGRVPMAAAMQVKWRRRKTMVDMLGWKYDRRYPSYFAGGPSSRRSQAGKVDDLDLSYSDRYTGEAGVVVRTSSPVADRMTLNSAAGYAWRGFDDDRLEARIGLQYRLANKYTAKTDCYWRSDHLYSNIRKQRRIQFELGRSGEMARNRLVWGYRSDEYNHRDDFLIMAESRIAHRMGVFAISCKLDRIEPDDMQNRYMYLTGWCEAKLSRSLNTYVRYTYRYRKNEPAGCYGTFRLDLNWTI